MQSIFLLFWCQSSWLPGHSIRLRGVVPANWFSPCPLYYLILRCSAILGAKTYSISGRCLRKPNGVFLHLHQILLLSVALEYFDIGQSSQQHSMILNSPLLYSTVFCSTLLCFAPSWTLWRKEAKKERRDRGEKEERRKEVSSIMHPTGSLPAIFRHFSAIDTYHLQIDHCSLYT